MTNYDTGRDGYRNGTKARMQGLQRSVQLTARRLGVSFPFRINGTQEVNQIHGKAAVRHYGRLVCRGCHDPLVLVSSASFTILDQKFESQPAMLVPFHRNVHSSSHMLLMTEMSNCEKKNHTDVDE